jgi:hypothetical protein
MKLKKRISRDITIKASENNGFIVEVGCARLSYSDHHEMCRDLADYLSNPEKCEKVYNEQCVSWGTSPVEAGLGGYETHYTNQIYGQAGRFGSKEMAAAFGKLS